MGPLNSIQARKSENPKSESPGSENALRVYENLSLQPFWSSLVGIPVRRVPG